MLELKMALVLPEAEMRPRMSWGTASMIADSYWRWHLLLFTVTDIVTCVDRPSVFCL